MNPWYAKTIVLLASVAMVAIRAPYGHRSRSIPIASRFRGTLEVVLLAIAWLAFFLPLVWVATSALAFADYPLHPAPLALGCACFAYGLWLFHRSHVDLGSNWSISLEIRETHQLVTSGLYGRVRHPMYLALLIYSVGNVLILPNWIAGPSYLVAMGLLVACRLGPEERMMRATFGAAWDEYAARTKRLVPGLW